LVVYRDDRAALSIAVAELERENEELKQEVRQLQKEAERARAQAHEDRKEGAQRGCLLCGGSLLPVAIFAGEDRRPIPLSISTLRFGSPDGGFTRSASLKAKVCSSCGFIHHFIDIAPGADITRELRIGPEPEPDPQE
jgi:hypothetical protein